ncbi:hypothetical protein BDP81DRAFT_14277 [Colletotrichum phormii]|uniref:Uncharacterized protein n=1 Tax=Colletotrichum phormii TaxID=359342 RepID=A0AAJ0EL86_9PEZI|nr:uncharacterized protein BDP81DRAFT_14277 [Colletotrichum phormii]KAK1656041.1 hypothetical protein BDP81DRAFT_14277 [Colletotrichum phormii]
MLLLALSCKGPEELILKHVGKSLEYLGTEANNISQHWTRQAFGWPKRRAAARPRLDGICLRRAEPALSLQILPDHRSAQHEHFRFRTMVCARQSERVCSVILGRRASKGPRSWSIHDPLPALKALPGAHEATVIEARPTLPAQSQGHLTSMGISVPSPINHSGGFRGLGQTGLPGRQKVLLFAQAGYLED